METPLEKTSEFKLKLIQKIKSAAQWNDNKNLLKHLDDYEAFLYASKIRELEDKMYLYVGKANELTKLLEIYRSWFQQLCFFVRSVRIAQTWKSKKFKEFTLHRLKKFDVDTFDGYIEKKALESDCQTNNSH